MVPSESVLPIESNIQDVSDKRFATKFACGGSLVVVSVTEPQYRGVQGLAEAAMIPGNCVAAISLNMTSLIVRVAVPFATSSNATLARTVLAKMSTGGLGAKKTKATII